MVRTEHALSGTKLSILGSDFKALISAATRFPSVGGFAGSEMVTLSGGSGYANAAHMGVVLCAAKVKAEGELPLLAFDERLLAPFAGLCPDDAKVVFTLGEKEVVLACKNRTITAPVMPGTEHKMPSRKGADMLSATVSPELASAVSYLANVAFSDSSRPELCAVMLDGQGQVMACNQKVIAVMKCASELGRVALPLPLAKTLMKGDTLYVSGKHTIVKSGIGLYAMPAPVKAQTDFPIASVEAFGKAERDVVTRCKGEDLAVAVGECSSVLSGVSKLEIVLVLKTVADKIELFAKNGTACYSTAFASQHKRTDTELRIPLDEMVQVSAFLAKEDRVTVASGKINGEVFVAFSGGFAMFPSFKSGK